MTVERAAGRHRASAAAAGTGLADLPCRDPPT